MGILANPGLKLERILGLLFTCFYRPSQLLDWALVVGLHLSLTGPREGGGKLPGKCQDWSFFRGYWGKLGKEGVVEFFGEEGEG